MYVFFRGKIGGTRLGGKVTGALSTPPLKDFATQPVDDSIAAFKPS